MTDKNTVLNEINDVLEYPWNAGYTYWQLFYLFKRLKSPQFDWRKLEEPGRNGEPEAVYFQVSYPSRVGHSIILDIDAWPAWDTAEQFADWIITTNRAILELESKLPDLQPTVKR